VILRITPSARASAPGPSGPAGPRAREGLRPWLPPAAASAQGRWRFMIERVVNTRAGAGTRVGCASHRCPPPKPAEGRRGAAPSGLGGPRGGPSSSGRRWPRRSRPAGR